MNRSAAPNPPAMKVEPLALDLIEVGPRARPVREAKVAALVLDIQERGLRQPIEVDAPRKGRFQLVSGAHRLEACRRLGWETIPAVTLRASANERERDELMENLARADLTALERAQYLATLRGLSLELFQFPARMAGDESAGSKSSELVGAIANRVGMSLRSTERYIALGELLDGDAADTLRGTPFEDSLKELDALSRHSPDKQRRIAALLTQGDPPAGSVAEAVAKMEGRAASEGGGEDKLIKGLLDRWRRAPKAARRAFAESLEDGEVEEIAAARGYALVPAGDGYTG